MQNFNTSRRPTWTILAFTKLFIILDNIAAARAQIERFCQCIVFSVIKEECV